MLDIDKSTVDFLVTENMVQEVEKVLSHDVPLVHAIVEEMVKRDIDRIYFVACGSPLNAAQTAKHLADRFSDLQVYAISGWEFCDNTPYRLDDRCAVIGVSDYGKTEEVIKALELGRACGALTAAFTKRADSPITSAAEFSIDYQAELYLGNSPAALLQRGAGDDHPPRAERGNRQDQKRSQAVAECARSSGTHLGRKRPPAW